MRREAVVLALWLAACEGSWSDADLEFAQVLPSTVLVDPTLGALPDGPGEGTFTEARNRVVGFRLAVERLTAAYGQVQRLPPGASAGAQRSWGPFADTTEPGTAFVVTAVREAERRFTWRLEARRPDELALATISQGTTDVEPPLPSGTRTLDAFVGRFRARLDAGEVLYPAEVARLESNLGERRTRLVLAGPDGGVLARLEAQATDAGVTLLDAAGVRVTVATGGGRVEPADAGPRCWDAALRDVPCP